MIIVIKLYQNLNILSWNILKQKEPSLEAADAVGVNRV